MLRRRHFSSRLDQVNQRVAWHIFHVALSAPLGWCSCFYASYALSPVPCIRRHPQALGRSYDDELADGPASLLHGMPSHDGSLTASDFRGPAQHEAGGRTQHSDHERAVRLVPSESDERMALGQDVQQEGHAGWRWHVDVRFWP